MKKVIGIHKICINNSIRTDSEKIACRNYAGFADQIKVLNFFFEKVIRNFKTSLPCITSGM